MKTKFGKEQPGNPVNPKDWMSILSLYRACLENAEDLLKEAELLLKHKHFARAYALGFTAYEEIGKSQIVADYFNGMVSETEFKSAFSSHYLKPAYVSRIVQATKENFQDSTIEYDTKKVKKYVQARMDALYVGYTEGYKPIKPKETFTEDTIGNVIQAARKELRKISEAEMNSERIGTKSFTK